MVRGQGSSGGSKPKGPTSAYGFFVKMCYEEHKRKFPHENVQVPEISKKCSEKWKVMTEAEKYRFQELALKDTERYQLELAITGDEGQPMRRRRQKKDPNAPKRALSAFIIYSQQKRPDIQKAHPEWRVGQIAQQLSAQWKVLSDDEKKIYQDMSTRDRERYETDMRAFKGGTFKPRPQKPKPVPGPSGAAPVQGMVPGPGAADFQQQMMMMGAAPGVAGLGAAQAGGPATGLPIGVLEQQQQIAPGELAEMMADDDIGDEELDDELDDDLGEGDEGHESFGEPGTAAAGASASQA